jgi:hypothetical protein
MGAWVTFLGIKRNAQRDAEHSLSFSADFQNARTVTGASYALRQSLEV